jgi:pyruvate-ferredoxin/flavodoxin oxidoreductase
MRSIGANPFQLDSLRPTLPLKDYAYNEIRYSSLAATDEATAAQLLDAAQRWVDEKFRQYEDLAARDGGRFWSSAPAVPAGTPASVPEARRAGA